jgi:uncharacterized protein YggE
LPTGTTDLATAFSVADYLDVSTINQTYVAQTATGVTYALFLFKVTHSAGQAPFTVGWTGRTNRAPSAAPVYLEIFNRTTTAWEALDSNSTAAANVDFLLTGSRVSNLGNYFDGAFEIAARVHQFAG